MEDTGDCGWIPRRSLAPAITLSSNFEQRVGTHDKGHRRLTVRPLCSVQSHCRCVFLLAR